MSEGRAAAMQVVERALSEQVELMVALHYLDMLKRERIREDLGDAVSGVGAECVAGGEA
jgi:hypothetical protein